MDFIIKSFDNANEIKDLNYYAGILVQFFKDIIDKKKLKCILEHKNVNHKEKINKEKNLKEAHAYCKKNDLSGQVFGLLLEDYIINHFNLQKQKASDGNGDFTHNGKSYELKCSLGGVSCDVFNYVQIRPSHPCDFMLTAYHLDHRNLKKKGVLYIFHIDNKQMLNICKERTLAKYAHGTSKHNKDKNIEDLEFAIRVKYNNKKWNMLMKYCVFKN